MPSIHRSLTLLAALVGSAAADAQPSRGHLTPGAYAIVNVNVVPMTADTVLRDMVVLVRDGRIAEISPARRTSLPRGIRRIDGGGGFLIPGLADVHTHLFADSEEPDSLAGDELALMIANGVTTARLMIGTPQHLTLRAAIRDGTLLGPQLWVASPEFVGRASPGATLVTTPDEARASVRTAAEQGYEFIKLTTGIVSPAVYDAIIEQAALSGVPVVGHVEPALGVARALAAGQQIEHFDAYFEAALADSSPIRTSLTQGGLFRLDSWRSLDFIDETKLAALAGATARAPGRGSWFSPTLNVFNDAFAVGPSEAEIHARPEWPLLPPWWRDAYLRARTRYWAETNTAVRTPARRQRYVELRNNLVKMVVDSGGHLLAGSDTPEWFHLYGWGLHRELVAYVAAGLSPYRALEAATRNPAAFFGAADQWGTIRRGLRADLVLLEGNPLEDIANVGRIRAVAVGGRWLDRAALDELIQRTATRRAPR